MAAGAAPMNGPITTSVILHLMLLAALIFGLPHMAREQIEFVQPIAIDIVDLGPVTTTQVQGTGKIAQKTEAVAAAEKKPEMAKPNPGQEKPVAEEMAPAETATETKEKPKPEKKEKVDEKSFDSLLKNLSQDKPTEEATEETPLKAEEGKVAGSSGLVSDKLTISQEDALRRQIEQCWNIPTGARDVQDMIIEVRIEVNPDRTVRSAEILDSGRMGDAFYRAAAESAKRAILNPRCSPLELPQDRYESWKVMTLRFNPKDVL